jgi:8-oxo-dGTP pyrophosphatase MutT (NUDIX family)
VSSQNPEPTVACTSVNGSQVTLPRSRLILRPSAYAVIRHEGQVALVTNRLSGRYYFPGGGTEPGERITDGLKREVWEEAGIQVGTGPLLHFAEDFLYYDPFDQAYHALLFYFACRPKTLALSTQYQTDDGEGNPQWVAVENLKSTDFHNHGTILLSVLQSTSVPQ